MRHRRETRRKQRTNFGLKPRMSPLPDLPSSAAAGRGARANSASLSNTRAGLIPARSSRTRAGPRRCSRAARETHRPTRGRRASAIWGVAYRRRLVYAQHSAPAIIETQDLTPFWRVSCFAGDPSGWEGCPASDVRARAGPRTAPRAGRRIRRAHVFDERSEEFALAPAARAAGPMRVARAEQAPWDTPPARDSCGTVKWTGAASGFSGLPPSLRSLRSSRLLLGNGIAGLAPRVLERRRRASRSAFLPVIRAARSSRPIAGLLLRRHPLQPRADDLPLIDDLLRHRPA